MSVSVALSAAAAGNAAAANYAAQQARKEAHQAKCKIVLAQFDSKTGSVEQAREYSECVQFMYPVEDNSPAPMSVKISIACILICAIVGMIIGATHMRDDEPIDMFMAGLVGLISGCVGALIVGFFALVGVILS